MSSEPTRTDIQIETDELIRLAKLMLVIDSDGHQDAADFQRGLDKLSPDDVGAVIALSKLLNGKHYAVHSNRPAFIDRMRKVAELIGATVAEVDADAWPAPRVVFAPPARQ
jgi:hypothetical protein